MSDPVYSNTSLIMRSDTQEKNPDSLTLIALVPFSPSPVFDSFGKPGSGIMEASLSFLGFYSECTGTSAPIGLNDSMTMAPEDEGPQYLFTGRYCLANLQLPNSALKSLQVRLLALFLQSP